MVPPLVLVDREHTLAACANNIYTLTITVRSGEWLVNILCHVSASLVFAVFIATVDE